MGDLEIVTDAPGRADAVYCALPVAAAQCSAVMRYLWVSQRYADWLGVRGSRGERLTDGRPRAPAEIQHQAQAGDLDRGLDPGGAEAEQGYAAHGKILPRVGKSSATTEQAQLSPLPIGQGRGRTRAEVGCYTLHASQWTACSTVSMRRSAKIGFRMKPA